MIEAIIVVTGEGVTDRDCEGVFWNLRGAGHGLHSSLGGRGYICKSPQAVPWRDG